MAELQEEHRRAAFPRRLIVDDVSGVEMVTLDSRVSGCVHTWLKHGGRVDDRLLDTLAACEQLLNRVIPALAGDEATYYQHLLDTSVLILQGRDDTRPE